MSRRNGSGIGCLPIIAVIVAVALFFVWRAGLIDRFLYSTQVDALSKIRIETLTKIASNKVDCYAYDQLSEEDRQKYLTVLDAFQTREERVYPESELDDLERIRNCVMADHPELFYVTGVQMNTTMVRGTGVVTSVTVEGDFSYSPEETEALQKQIEAVADECLAGAPENADGYALAKYLYEWLVSHVEYDHEANPSALEEENSPAGQNMVDALVTGKAVCSGYAHAYQFLLQRAGIPGVYMKGTANGGGHAWCAAYLDGNWYYIDPTWGDPQFLDDLGQKTDSGRVNYDYLCVTGRDIATTHTVDDDFIAPVCVATTDNYYVREGLYLEEPDVQAAGRIIERAYDAGEEHAVFRCSNRDVFDRMSTTLFDEQQLYRFIPGNTYGYYLNEDLLTITVKF